MSRVPSETLQVAWFGTRDTTAEDKPEYKAWMLNSQAGGTRSIRIWTTPKFLDELEATYPQIRGCYFITSMTGFVRGRPLLDKVFDIRSCGVGGEPRPERLYRVVHSESPFEGIKARSHELYKTNPITFQNRLQKHLIWTCRQPSPFMSASESRASAAIVGAFYEARERTGIQVLTIDTTSPQWSSEQRIWNLAYLEQKFGISQRTLGNVFKEYLIEDSIPPECVVRRQDWDAEKDKFDPTGQIRDIMARRFHAQESQRERKRARDESEDVDQDLRGKTRSSSTRTTRFVVNF